MTGRKRDYQLGFSAAHADDMYDLRSRRQKAAKILAVLENHFGRGLSGLTVLDVGCSTGIIGEFISRRLARVVGTDIDADAVRFAKQHFECHKLSFQIADAMFLPFASGSFDAAVCAHVYEHVPDSEKLFSEFHRVLKPGGVCFLAATNRLALMEAHYGLPFLSLLPRPLAHLYVRAFDKAEFYYERPLSFWSLRQLARRFEIIDYTAHILRHPARFAAEDVLRPGSPISRVAAWVCGLFPWLSPTFIWLLVKPP